MILPIVAYGDPVLKKKAIEINSKHPNLKKLIENMWETMYAAHGVGLAAPQIGESIRLFIVDGTITTAVELVFSPMEAIKIEHTSTQAVAPLNGISARTASSVAA